MPNKRLSPHNAKKAQLAADLKIAGHTWQQIAKEIGYKSASSAYELVERYFNQYARDQNTMMLPVMQERAEMLWREAIKKVSQGSRSNNVELWDKGMAHSERALNFLAKIHGYGNGPQVQVNVVGSSELSELRSEFLGLLGGVVDGEVVDEGDEGDEG